MKASLPISIVALLLSIAAFTIAITSNTNVNKEEIQRQVDLALARKEKAHVQSWASKMDQIYQDILGPRYEKPQKEPETFAELFEPAIQIVKDISQSRAESSQTIGSSDVADTDKGYEDIASLYRSLSAAELSMRFSHPELYEGRDDFSRSNALSEILTRRLIHRGMTTREVTLILGRPDESDGITIGQPFEFQYGRLATSQLTIFFGVDERVSRIHQEFDHPHSERSRDF